MIRVRSSRAAMVAALLVATASSPYAASWSVWRDIDFARGDGLDADMWRFEQGFQRNREKQYYATANVELRDGVLVIEARRQEIANAAYRKGARDWRHAPSQAAYTSGSIVLREPFLYGRVEVVARSPSGLGLWPAIWLLSESASEYGEIDLYEAVGKHPDTVFAAVHFGQTAGTRDYRNGNVVLPGFERSWRTHALEWTPERIAMTVDAKPVFSFDPREAARAGADPLRRPMFLHLNLALGGSWGGPIDDSALPARFEIASIRIFKWSPQAEARTVDDPSIRWGR